MKVRISSSLLAAVIIVSGCTTTDPQTGEKHASDASKGAGIGAAAGAVLGAMTSNKSGRTKGVLTGAIAGAAVGGGVGYAMDKKQEEKLRQQMANTGVKVESNNESLKLVIPGNVSFASGNADIAPSFYPVLDQLAQSLNEYPESTIKIVGYTDTTGSLGVNQQLSRARANAVGMYLGQHGVAMGRIQTDGLGPNYPIASNDTADGRAQNRRVEIKITPTNRTASN